LKVVHIIDSLSAGGSESMAVNIVNGLINKKVNVDLIVTRKSGKLESRINNNVNVYKLNKQSSIDLFSFIKLVKLLNKNKYNIIHAHSSSILWIILSKYFINSCIIIWHVHYGNSWTLSDFITKMYKFCASRCDLIFVVNDELNNWVCNKLKIHKNRIITINNFVSESVIERVEEMEQMNFTNTINVVCVANLRPEKDILNLLNAFLLLAEKVPNVNLHLLGNNNKDSYSNIVLGNINSHKYRNRIFYWGAKNNINSWLRYMDIGVIPSKSEGLPVAILEYGQAGLRVVSTNVGQIPKVLEYGKFGILVEPENNIQLANGINDLIGNFKNEPKYSFKVHIENHYSEVIVMEELYNIYNNLMANCVQC